jgi:hypothetical protein
LNVQASDMSLRLSFYLYAATRFGLIVPDGMSALAKNQAMFKLSHSPSSAESISFMEVPHANRFPLLESKLGKVILGICGQTSFVVLFRPAHVLS